MKPLHKKIVAFAVRGRQKRRDFSGLWVGNSDRGDKTRAEDIWVHSSAADCRVSPWKKGQHLLISDAFETDEGTDGFNLWETACDDPEFAFVKKYASEVGGRVETIFVHENSIIAEVEGDLVQEEYQW